MILYVKKPTESTHTKLESMNEINNVIEHKTKIQKLNLFLNTCDEQMYRNTHLEIKKKIFLFYKSIKNIKCFGINIIKDV